MHTAVVPVHWHFTNCFRMAEKTCKFSAVIHVFCVVQLNLLLWLGDKDIRYSFL